MVIHLHHTITQETEAREPQVQGQLEPWGKGDPASNNKQK